MFFVKIVVTRRSSDSCEASVVIRKSIQGEFRSAGECVSSVRMLSVQSDKNRFKHDLAGDPGGYDGMVMAFFV